MADKVTDEGHFDSHERQDPDKYYRVIVPNYDDFDSDSFLHMGRRPVDENVLSKKGRGLWEQYDNWAYNMYNTALYDQNRDGYDLRPPWHGGSDDPDGFYSNIGWRDHTDGNRLTTTAGDKIEIVGGNYQMIVMGRKTASEGVITDHSGGIEWAVDQTPTLVTKVEWKWSKFGGTWKVTEESEKGHTHSIFHGETLEEFKGSRNMSITGSPSGRYAGDFDPTSEGSGEHLGDPEVKSGTWARSILDVTQSSGKIESYTKSSTEIASETDSPTITDTTLATNITSSTTSTTITDTTTAATITNTTTAALITETTTAGTITSTTTGNQHSTNIGNVTDITLGTANGINLGGAFDLFIGGKLDLSLAAVLELAIAKKTTFNIGISGEFNIGASKTFNVGPHKTFGTGDDETDITKKVVAMGIFLG